jgi:hypothetical protein
MRTLGLFNIAALIASSMVLAIAFVLLPVQAWSPAMITSVIIFTLAVGLLFYAPSAIFRKQSKRDAAQLATIGPIGAITGWFLLLAAGAVVLSILGHEKIVIALDIFAVGTFVIGGLMLRASMNIVNEVSENYTISSNHIKWQSHIQGLCNVSSEKISKELLDGLADKLRYVASDISGGSPMDSDIDTAISEIGSQLDTTPGANIESLIKKIDMLLAKRDIFLRTARSKI